MQASSQKNNLTSVRVKKITQEKAVVEILNSKVEFSLPLEILSENIKVDERLEIKILDTSQINESRDDFARKLLEKMIN